MSVITLPIAEYMPDQPDLLSKGSSTITNVYPRTANSYGSVASANATAYGALGARCQGGAGFVDSTAAVKVFAGTATDIYYVTAGLSTWANVSKSVGTYGCDTEQYWQFAYFNGDVIAINIADAPQVYTLGTSTNFADLTGSPPKARYISIIKNAFVMLGHTNDTTNGVKPQRLWWSAAGNHQSWPTPGTTAAAQVQAGSVDLLGDDGWVMGIAADLSNADAIVIQEYAVRRITYVGPPDIFTMLPLPGARGTPAPYSIVSYGGVAYYLGQDGFYACDGSSIMPIGVEKVDKTFFADLDYTFVKRVVGVADPLNRLIWWAYASTQSTSGLLDTLLCYNIVLQRWTKVSITCETLLELLGIGYTLDELYTLLGYTLDTLPAPLDSPVWQGGRLTLGTFNSSHVLCFLTGTPLAATVEFNEVQPFQGKRAFVRNARALVDGGTPSVAIGKRERLVDSVSYTAESTINSVGYSPVRISGRYVRPRVKVPASSTWTNISGVEIDVEPQGTVR